MTGGSHHVQGVKLNGRHCYACHWEATPEGKIDERYHAREAGQNTPKVSAPVELVIWASGQRLLSYKPDSTAITFQSSAIGTVQEARK